MRVLNETKLERLKTYIHSFQRERGSSPTFRQIVKEVKGFENLEITHRYVSELVKRGFIQKDEEGRIELPFQLNPGGMSLALMVGTIPCGTAEVMQDEIEYSYALPVNQCQVIRQN